MKKAAAGAAGGKGPSTKSRALDAVLGDVGDSSEEEGSDAERS